VSAAWRNLLLDERCLIVSQQLQRKRGGGLVVRPVVKTERSEAPVALTALAVRALRAHRAAFIEERLGKGDAWRGTDDPVAPDALVFTTEVGTPIDPDNLGRRLNALLAQAGLSARGPHAAGRHTTASLLGALGVAPAVAAQVLRHSRVTTTLNASTPMFCPRTREPLPRSWTSCWARVLASFASAPILGVMATT